MKKICFSIVVIACSATSFPTFADDEVIEVVVTGQRYSSGGGLSTSTTPLPQNNNDADSGGGLAAEKRRRACIASADDVGKKCDTAYVQLQPVCSALTGYFGARLAATFWARALGTTMDQKAVEAMKSGGALTGYNKDDTMINCTWLTSQAKAYCASGVQKLKSKCT